jgi:filamin
LKLTLGLIWTLILRFQIERGEGNSAKNALLEWVRSMIPEYDIKNFTSDWQSGKAIYALANACEPGVLPADGMTNNPIDNTTKTFATAEEKMGIPQVLDPVDMVENPDEHSNMLYINYYRDYLDKARSREAELKMLRTAVPGNCRAYGPGLEGGEVFIETEFTIEAVNAKGTICPCGGHPWNVKIKGPKSDVDFKLEDFENGTYRVSYTPVDQGVHSISITIYDKHIPKSAFKVFINPAVADASKSLAYGPGLEGGVTGADSPFTVEVRNRNGDKIPAGGQNVEVKVKGPFAEIPANKVDNKDGTHSVTYRPLDVGEHTVEVNIDGKPVANSPFKLFVDAPEGSANWENSYAEGPGLEDGNTTAEPTHYTIHTVDKNGNPVKKGGSPVAVEIIGPDGSPVDADLKDNNDGTFTVTYHPTEPGDYTVESILRNPFRPTSYEHIKNSPKTVHVEPGTDASKSFAHGPGLEDGILDTLPTQFTIQAADRDGKKMDKGGDPFDVKIKDAKGNDVPFDLKDNNDGTYTVDYKPNGPGEHTVDVNLRGKPIKNAPHKVGVKAGSSAAYSLVEGYTFTIQAKTATGENRVEGGENFEVSITGPNGPVNTVELKDLGNGKYFVSYQLPEDKGEYKISATVNGENIKGSPWNQIVF